VVLLNDSAFSHREARVMHLQNSVMQAAAFRLPIVRVSNSGITCLIHEDGKVVLPLRNNFLIGQSIAANFSVQPHRQKTFYAQYGDIFGWACLIFVIIFLFQEQRRQRRDP
jgi:apolipoprotein N-acyltransferase